MSEILSHVDDPPTPSRIPNRLRQVGCVLGALLWFLLLLLPCSAVVLIVQRDVAIPLGALPGQSARIWLVDEARTRGVAISLPNVQNVDEDLTCLQTDSQFLLWMGQGEPVSYCECFRMVEEVWQLQGTQAGVCNPDQ